eukprot:CAMPEP_0174876896 /NCGR_PEP_ID=MMETSP1114-20130205/80939_1 /TAXON_ID=312471 /ORGANISM="Neobodo designis, Strain CCAP 1951/1" /LENGTH=225 /DNA_ID=CAMNT_0016112269 /DNA_START=42 /DNA_END=716 /DNA_ORIENTATION=+
MSRLIRATDGCRQARWAPGATRQALAQPHVLIAQEAEGLGSALNALLVVGKARLERVALHEDVCQLTVDARLRLVRLVLPRDGALELPLQLLRLAREAVDGGLLFLLGGARGGAAVLERRAHFLELGLEARDAGGVRVAVALHLAREVRVARALLLGVDFELVELGAEHLELRLQRLDVVLRELARAVRRVELLFQVADALGVRVARLVARAQLALRLGQLALKR